MKFLLVIVLAMLGFFYINHSVNAPLAAKRASEQRALILQLEEVNTEDSKNLARQWRQAHPEPTDRDLSELALIVARVQADPKVAGEYTILGRQRSRAELESVFTPLVGWGPRPTTPGID